MTGEGACFRGHAFLQTTVARQTNAMLIENSVFARVKPRGSHLHRRGNAHRVANALPERPGGAFNSRRFKKLWMTRRFRMQLPETFDLRHGQIVTAHVQPRVKEHRAVAG